MTGLLLVDMLVFLLAEMLAFLQMKVMFLLEEKNCVSAGGHAILNW